MHQIKLSTSQSAHASFDLRMCDSRYRSIIGRLNGMREKLRRDPGCDLAEDLDQLVSATLSHIGPEESSMEMVAYPETGAHRLCHRTISIDTARLRYRIGIGGPVTEQDIEHLRCLWLEHMELHDRPFERFLSRGR